jgi:hypothetical protein
MMKRKGKVVVEDLVVFNKPVKKHQTFRVKEVQKILEWIKMECVEHKWAKQVSLEGISNI